MANDDHHPDPTPEQGDAAFQQLTTGLDLTVRQIATAFQQLGDVLQHVYRSPELRLVMQAVGALGDRLQRAYEDAGAPYGPAEEGLHRWVREQGEVVHALREAEEQIRWDHHLQVLGRHLREHPEPTDPACPRCATVRLNRGRATPSE